MGSSPPGSSVHGIFLASILEWVAIPSSRGPSQLRGESCVSCIAGGFFTAEPLGKLSVKALFTNLSFSCMILFSSILNELANRPDELLNSYFYLVECQLDSSL